MNNTVLRAENVRMTFDGRDAVKDLSFELGSAERVALLGHNGAGKTTFFKMSLGFLTPTDGRIEVLGAEPGSDKARASTAFLPESVAFQRTLTGVEVLKYYAKLKGEDAKKAIGLLERVGLAEAGRRRVGTYSKGMRQRLGLAQALIGTPKLVLLDEPTSGLDPISRQNFYDLVTEISGNGATVLLSSHALTEMEARTDRILIMSKGKLVANDTLDHLRTAARLPIRLKVKSKEEPAEQLANRLGGTPVNCRSVEIMCAHEDKIARIAAVTSLGAMIEDIDVHLPTLDDVYKHFSEKADLEDSAGEV
ncbi:Cu-processing system ATP-binding protein [Pseudovibrio ascidiaceicola]|uniref:Cu-processing system ATP-binding protein n=1 Tax=Pseudovibrio ascidiaceicola TaxID=285279 RepID=A0A1I4D451_9HYPH|nr:ABC transporter ATP-binding protein [Pseudovibrio ascidiaceicola]SFK87549.1 Cu-processing system ATP-binding protein [Pseudovibrio ascidiaceicola]